MPARATQPAGYPSGQAQVQVTGAGAVDVDTLEVCVSGLLDDIERVEIDRIGACHLHLRLSRGISGRLRGSRGHPFPSP